MFEILIRKKTYEIIEKKTANLINFCSIFECFRLQGFCEDMTRSTEDIRDLFALENYPQAQLLKKQLLQYDHEGLIGQSDRNSSLPIDEPCLESEELMQDWCEMNHRVLILDSTMGNLIIERTIIFRSFELSIYTHLVVVPQYFSS